MTTETLQLHDLLIRLRITPNYKGFYFIDYAVQLAIQQPERLLHVTKWLYPDVAKRFGTNRHCVERNIRTVISIAWQANSPLLETLARHPLSVKPTPSQFLSILIAALYYNRTSGEQTPTLNGVGVSA